MTYNNTLYTLKELAKVIGLWLAIIFVILAIIWFIVSIVGNCAGPESGNEYNLPDASEARYRIHIRATNQLLYSPSVEVPEPGAYLLHGWYQLDEEKQKFIWHEGDILLDTHYFGPISVIDRLTRESI